MSAHKCPKITDEPGHPFQVVNGNIPCWVCDLNARRRYSVFMPHLSALREWVDTGYDTLSYEQWEMLYEYFFDSLDYGTMTGDTGTIDEWLSDRPDRVKELVDTVEYYCVAVA